MFFFIWVEKLLYQNLEEKQHLSLSRKGKGICDVTKIVIEPETGLTKYVKLVNILSTNLNVPTWSLQKLFQLNELVWLCIIC
jgi:hypothetical protein